MEKISGQSQLKLVPQLIGQHVTPTMIGIRQHYKMNIPCMTSVESAMASRTFQFQVSWFVGGLREREREREREKERESTHTHTHSHRHTHTHTLMHTNILK